MLVAVIFAAVPLVLFVIAPTAFTLAAVKDNVPPKVRFPVDVTVPLKVNPLTVPVPLTLVTVPTLNVLFALRS